MKNISFEQLPQAVCELYGKLESIEQLLLANNTKTNQNNDTWFDLNELCQYLPDKPKKQTVYGWVNQRLIPFHKTTKKLQFLKSEIDNWIKSGRKQTIAEIKTEVEQSLTRKKK